MIQAALQDGGDDLEILLLDVLEIARGWFEWVYVHPYWWMLKHSPGTWRALFELRNRQRHRATAPDWVFRHGCATVLQRLRDFAPSLVIATEIGAAEIAALGRREDWFEAPILAVQTDYHAEPPWVQREVDYYCVGSEEARFQLVRWGASPNRILVSGVPIDPSFALRLERMAVLQSLGLVARKPVVLVMGGGMGPAPLDEIVASLQHCGLPVQVLAVAGHNQTMHRRLERMRRRLPIDLHPFGWTSQVRELMAAADLLITKPGGLTVAESLAAGVPLLLTEPIPGPEERHVSYLVERGAALYAHTLDQIPKMTSTLLTSPAQRARMVKRQLELGRPDAAHAVAQVARALMEKTAYKDLVAAAAARESGELAYLM
jgi:processive 1,2-diacylglycerol beta-glucosyltransferase